MIVIPRGNPFLAECERSGCVREIRDILTDVLAAYGATGDAAPSGIRKNFEPAARGGILAVPIDALTMQAGANSHCQ